MRVSMLDTVMAFLWGSDMGSQTFVGTEIPQQEAASFIDLIYETADGYISVAVQQNREWAGLTRALEKPEWLEDERFKTPALRQKHIDVRLQMIQDALMTRTAAEWLERLEAEDVPCAPVLTRTEVLSHPQVEASGVIIETEHEHAGLVRQTRPAATFSRTAPEIRHGGPLLGEHTSEVLSEAGFSEEDVRSLTASGAVNGLAST